MTEQMRIAVVSTPRSGNTWLRHLLMGLYGLKPYAVHHPAELDWDALSPRAALQLHWHPTEDFRGRLDKYGFHVVTIHRHPFDVLISVLQFALWDSGTSRWLDGEAGDERSILAAMPRSTAFGAYVASPRAKALLSLSAEWVALPGVQSLCYEDLVADTVGGLTKIAVGLGREPVRPIGEVVEANSLTALRTLTKRPDHFWRGQPGQWRHLLDVTTAGVLSKSALRREPYDRYAFEADPDLTPEQADRNWVEAVGPGIAAALASTRRPTAALHDDGRPAGAQDA